MQASGDTSDIRIPSVYIVYQDYSVLRSGGIDYFPDFPIYQVLILKRKSNKATKQQSSKTKTKTQNQKTKKPKNQKKKMMPKFIC
jgi:hypothetical protein